MFGKKAVSPDQSPRTHDTSFIEDGLVFTGNTVSTGNVHVEGEIQGDVKCAQFSIGENGRVNGKVHAEEVVISGNLTGSISGERVMLKPGCDVRGDISYGSLSVEHGAHYEGKSKRSEKSPTSGAKAKAKSETADKPVASDVGNGKVKLKAEIGALEQSK